MLFISSARTASVSLFVPTQTACVCVFNPNSLLADEPQDTTTDTTHAEIPPHWGGWAIDAWLGMCVNVHKCK